MRRTPTLRGADAAASTGSDTWREGWLVGSLGLAALLLCVAHAWVAAIGSAIPDAARQNDPSWGSDARLGIWVLGWVAHILPRAPASLFDPPVGYPAPSALTGSEHLIALQLLFGPVYAVSGNPVLAANVTVLVSYLLGGVAMLGLLRWWGFGLVAALAGGVATMFGLLQVPSDIHVIQHPPFCLPLVLWAAEAAVRSPSRRAAGVLVAALTLALLTSYQSAVMAMFLMAILLARQLWRGAAGRRAAGALLVALIPVGVLLLAISVPYLPRLLEPRYRAPIDWGLWDGLSWAARLNIKNHGLRWSFLLAGLITVVAQRRLDAGKRRAASIGLLAILVGGLFAAGFTVRVGSLRVVLPYALFALSPTGPAVMPWRFLLLASLGFAIVSACAIEVVQGVRKAGWLLAAALLVAITLESARAFGPRPLTYLPVGSRVPPVYAWIRDHGGGPVLEMPNLMPDLSGRRMFANAEAMYFQLFHWQPLLNLRTNHIPLAAQLVDGLVDQLPAAGVLAAVSDMTHVRWILVRPDRLPHEWLERWHSLDAPGIVRAATFDDGTMLFEVTRTPRPGWFEALSKPPRPDATLLGTPLVPLRAPAGAVAAVLPAGPLGAERFAPVALRIRNEGAEPWPVAVGRGDPDLAVHLEALWDGPSSRAVTIPLPYDVEPGETVAFEAWLGVPPVGSYALRWRLVQPRGPTFAEDEPATSVRVE